MIHPEVKQEPSYADAYFSNSAGEVFIEPDKLNYMPYSNQFQQTTNQQAIYPPSYFNSNPQNTNLIKTESHIGWSVFSCLCCCILLGIPALICSCQAQDQFQRGELAAGAESARCAKTFNIAACSCGAFYCILILILWAAGVVYISV